MDCSAASQADSPWLGSMVGASARAARGGSTVSVTPADIAMAGEGGSIGEVSCGVSAMGGAAAGAVPGALESGAVPKRLAPPRVIGRVQRERREILSRGRGAGRISLVAAGQHQHRGQHHQNPRFFHFADL
ncbi:hypothetical protein [Burkholderia gladioli]|uniref:hypothetical protein n=1 Tax=Burkholderia gladioli TaxID=28095 RepID=UPI0034DAF3DA